MRPQSQLGAQTLVDLADQALYLAKQSGRDRACTVASPSREPSTARPVAVPRPLADQPASPLRQRTWPWPAARLRFDPEQERAYQRSIAGERRRWLPMMSLIGLLLLDLSLWLNAPAWQAQASLVQSVMCWANVLAVLCVIVMSMGHRPVPHMEWAFSLALTALGVTVAWLLGHGQTNLALAFSVSLALLPTFGAACARQALRYTLLPAVVTVFAAAFCFSPRGGEQALIYGDSLTMIATNCLFALIMAFTLEQGQRQVWRLRCDERELSRSLASKAQALKALTMQDPLTGISNRRQFDADMEAAWAGALAQGQTLAMLVIDVDHFKRYNDHHGHPAGDACLQQVAKAIAQLAGRHGGVAARLGGEEFGVLLSGPAVAAASAIADEVVKAVGRLAIPHPTTLVPGLHHVSASAGVGTLVPAHNEAPSRLFSLADQALYQAKHAGRNRAVLFAAAASPAPAQASGAGTAATHGEAQTEHAHDHG
jgi:diguanylate cyclase (GGDEF)-like protein